MVGLTLAYGRFVPESNEPTKKQGAAGIAERILRTATR